MRKTRSDGVFSGLARCCGVIGVLGALAALEIGSAFAAARGTGAVATPLGPCALAASKDGATLYVACADARQVLLVDLARGEVSGRIGAAARPTGLVLSPDGAKLYVACAAAQSVVAVIDTASHERLATIRVGHTAIGPVISPDGKRLYVCNRFDGDVSVIDLAAGRQTARVPVVREPVAAAITPDGRYVVVGNHLPADRADGLVISATVTIIDTASLKPTTVRLPDGSTGVRGVCISPDGKYALVTHILSNFELVASQVEQGWMNTNALSVIDIAKKEFFKNILLDDLSRGAANPWGVAFSADARRVCVAHAGTHEMSVIQVSALLDGGLHSIGQFRGPLSGPSILENSRRRIPLGGNGPRALAAVGSKVYAAEYFSDTLAVVDVASKTDRPVTTIRLGPPSEPTIQRRGEMLFNDAALCYEHWQSCASCHPDGRADGLNWDLLNDGVGNPKNARSLLLAHRTPPSMATGVRKSAEEAVRAGIEGILFSDRREEEAAAIDAYLKSLRPVPSPHLAQGRLSPAAERGKRLFQSRRVGCYRCHPPPLYTDRRMHDVTKPNLYDHRSFDTPTLVEVWRTAPYLYDGRYATVKALLAEGHHGLSRGKVEVLTEEELDDLVEFVLSL